MTSSYRSRTIPGEAITLESSKGILTPEQVTVRYTLAGIGTRFAAVLIDTCIQGLLALALLLALGSFLSGLELPRVITTVSQPWMLVLLAFVLGALMWAYFIFWETVWNGQTPGKRLAGIRVLRDGGYPVDFRTAFVRNICRFVDVLPGGYLVGIISMFLSKDSKRLGDYAAGTIVVMDSQHVLTPPPPPPEATMPYRLLGDPALLNLRAISRSQFEVMERFLDRRPDLSPEVAASLARQVALPLLPLIGMEQPTAADYPYGELLGELARAYRTLASQ